MQHYVSITKTSLFKYAENFTTKKKKKKWKFSDKNSDIFHISAQNMDCGYSLEPPRHSKTQTTAKHFTVISIKLRFDPDFPSKEPNFTHSILYYNVEH